MRFPYSIFVSCFLFCFHALRGAETDSVSIRTADIYANPAARFFEQTHGVSDIKVSGRFLRQGDAYLLQTGKEMNEWKAEARSWMPIGEHSRIWGKAAYRYGTRKSVSWNETSDFELLYPYVMADSVGGNLRGKCYDFNGGYARKKRRFTWGVQLDYRAEIEYRAIDPRPRNVISDLKAKAGGTCRFTENYRIGASVGFRKYHQENDVDFYSTLGNAFVHTMTGLGHTYTRFTGSRTSVDYKGNGYTATLQFFTEKACGWRVYGEYTHLGTIRHLKNDDNIPLTEMNDNRLQSSVSWLHPWGKSRIGLSTQILLVGRKGQENLFDSGNGTSYEKISSRQPYSDKQKEWEIAAFFEPRLARSAYMRCRPHYSRKHIETTHTDNKRRMEITRSSIGLDIEIRMPLRHSQWSLKWNGAYQPVDKHELFLNDISHDAMFDMYEHDFHALSADRTLTALLLRGTFPCKAKIKLYGEAGWETSIYRHLQGNNHKVEISFGVRF